MKKKTGWHFHISAAFQCLETNISTGSSQLPEKHRARLLSGACQASPRRTQSCNGVPLLSSGELSVCCDIRNLSIHYSSRPHSTPTGAAESHDSGSSVYQEDWHQHKEETAGTMAGGMTERESGTLEMGDCTRVCQGFAPFRTELRTRLKLKFNSRGWIEVAKRMQNCNLNCVWISHKNGTMHMGYFWKHHTIWIMSR